MLACGVCSRSLSSDVRSISLWLMDMISCSMLASKSSMARAIKSSEEVLVIVYGVLCRLPALSTYD